MCTLSEKGVNLIYNQAGRDSMLFGYILCIRVLSDKVTVVAAEAGKDLRAS
jgi:hypothetical protein